MIDSFNNIGMDKIVSSIYDFGGMTEQETWSKFAQKINIIIEHFNYLDKKFENEKELNKEKLDYLLGEGLTEQVAKQLIEKITDGTFGKLINETLLKDINDKVVNFKEEFNELLNITTNKINFLDENKLKFLYGAKLDGVTDDSVAIQEALNDTSRNNGILHFPACTCVIEKELTLPSNIHLKLNSNTTILKKHTGNYFAITKSDVNTTGYDGAKNIIIEGGKFKFDGIKANSNGFVLFHANNVTFKDVIFENITTHCIDICGCKNIKILNCDFNGYLINENSLFREVIQLDVSARTGCPYFESNSICYDGTTNDTIIVENCSCGESEDMPAPLNFIGTHGQYSINKKHNNLIITNNVLYGSSSNHENINHNGSAIRPMQWENVIIANNKIEGFNRGITFPIYEEVYNLTGNVIRDINNPVNKNDNWVGFSKLNIYGNTIKIANGYVYPAISFHISSGVLKLGKELLPTFNMVNISNNIIHQTYDVGHVASKYIYANSIDGMTIDNNIIWGNGKEQTTAVYIGINDYYPDTAPGVIPLQDNITIGLSNQFGNVNSEVFLIETNGTQCYNMVENYISKNGGDFKKSLMISPINNSDYSAYGVKRNIETDEYKTYLGLQNKSTGLAVGIQLVKNNVEVNRLNIGDTYIEALSNNMCDIGRSGVRFKDIYATNGVINTSDRNYKKDIIPTTLGLDFINKLKAVDYKFIDNTSNRIHTGLIAQDVEEVLKDNDRAMLIKSNFIDEETGEEKEIYALRYNELIAPLIKSIQELSEKVKLLESN